MRARWVLCVGTAIALAVPPVALAQPDSAPTDPMLARAAACVAALKARAEPLAQRVREGDEAAEVPLIPIVTASFAFIGTAYKRGLRSPQADEMLRRAEQAQAGLSREALVSLQDGCQAEGDQLLARANALERTLVGVAARKRIARLRKSA